MLAKKNIWSKVGVWSFVAGLIIAALVALFAGGDMNNVWLGVLGLLGLLVGLLNVADEEVNLFLIASLTFLVAAGAIDSVLSVLPGMLSGWVVGFLQAIMIFVGPAAFVVSLVALYHVAKDQ